MLRFVAVLAVASSCPLLRSNTDASRGVAVCVARFKLRQGEQVEAEQCQPSRIGPIQARVRHVKAAFKPKTEVRHTHLQMFRPLLERAGEAALAAPKTAR